MRILFSMILAINAFLPLFSETSSFEGRVENISHITKWLREITFKVPEDSLKGLFPGCFLRLHVPPYQTNTSDWKEPIPDRFQKSWEKFNFFGHKLDRRVLDPGLSRPFSVVRYDEKLSTITFLVKIVWPTEPYPWWGVGSSYVFSLKPGDEVSLSGPFGHPHDVTRMQPLVFIIGGCGIAHARSLIDYELEEMNSIVPIVLLYAAHSMEEAVYHKHFLELRDRYPNFHFRLFLVEDINECDCVFKKSDMMQVIKEDYLETVSDMLNTVYHLCGREKNNQLIKSILIEKGVQEEKIIIDV